MEVKVSTRGRKGMLKKSIRVYSNDPASPVTTLTMKGTVEIELGLDKTYLRLHDLEIGKTQENRIQIVAKSLKGLSFGAVDSGNPDVVASIVWDKDAKGQRTPFLEVKVTPTKLGRLSRTVKVATNRENPKELVLRISGEVSGDLTIQPKSITFYGRNDNKPQERFITVSSKKKSFKVVSAKDTKGELKTKVQAIEKDKQYKITVSPPENISKNFSTKLTVTTNHPDQPTLEIPIHVRIPKPRPLPKKPGVGLKKK